MYRVEDILGTDDLAAFAYFWRTLRAAKQSRPQAQALIAVKARPLEPDGSEK